MKTIKYWILAAALAIFLVVVSTVLLSPQIGAVALMSVILSFGCLLLGKAYQISEKKKAKKHELNKEKYGIEKAKRLKKRQSIIDCLIKLALVVAAILFTIWWCIYR